MFDDLEITLTHTEPTAGDNVTIRYGNATETGAFSLAAVMDHVAQLNATLKQAQPALDILKSAGSTLFDELLGGDLLRAYAQATAPGRRVRLRLNSKLPDLVAIPWEYLYDRKREQWLALQPDLSLVRSLPIPGRKPVAVEGMLRVLVMISAPSGLPPLDTTVEWANLESVADVAAIELIQVKPTYEALLGALRQQPHVFHFIGHGLFDTDAQQGLLYLQKADGSPDPISAERLATLLIGCESLRLALLNACQGATPGNRSAFAGVAQKLIQQGLPAVIAMQTPILDTDALAFSQEFYRALADGYPLEAALGEGRKRIADRSSAWGVPALYCQGSEPFAIPILINEQKADRLWQRTQAVHDPPRQRALLTRLLALVPSHAEARAALTRLEKADQAAHLYAAALAYIETAHWREAQRALEQVEQLSPNFRDTRTRLAEVLGKLPAVPSAESFDYAARVERYRPILNALLEGRLTLFLGDNVSSIGRPTQDRWVEGLYPPGATDAARALAGYLPPELKQEGSVLQISQYTLLLDGEFALYDRLTALYGGNYTPTMLHRLLAEIPARLAAKGYPKGAGRRYVLFSTAFDTLLEQAFDETGQRYHLFAYRPRFVDNDGVIQIERFLHYPPATDPRTTEQTPIEVLEPNRYSDHDGDNYPIIVKLCGRRVTIEPDSVAVTEDQYMNYTSAEKSMAVLPTSLLNQIKRNSFLFFGHSLQPWHLRLLWQRLHLPTGERQPPKWAIVPALTRIEEKFWQSQRIDPLVAAPEGVVAYVNDWLTSL